MRTLKFILLISLTVLAFSCNNNSNKKHIIYLQDSTVTFNCFCDSLMSEKGKPLVCEPSAILFFDDTVYIANDKNMPNSAAIFKTKYSDGLDTENLKFSQNSMLMKGIKYEDLSISPDNKFIFLTTGFDRIKPNTNEWDNYNNLYYWSTSNFDNVKMFTDINDSTSSSSKHLRKVFAQHIDTAKFPDGVPYFKIEGIASIPGDTLLFAIREYGKSYKDFTYCMKIIAIIYKTNNGNITLSDTAKLLFDYNPNKHKTEGVNRTIGISSIEYNKYDKHLYMLTSYELGEKAEEVGAYLWRISLPDLQSNKHPELVYNENKKPLHFAHKAEGITVVDSTTFIVIHDDDRVYGPEIITDAKHQFKRKHNQAAYTILHKKYNP